METDSLPRADIQARALSAVTGAGGVRSGTKLCIAAINFHPVYAGPAERFKRYLPGLKARSVEVSVCTGTPDPSRGAACGLPAEWATAPTGSALPVEVVDGVPIHRFRLPDEPGLRREGSFAWSVSRFCRAGSGRPDVVQLLSSSPATIPALLRLRQLEVPTVLTYTMMPGFAGHPWKLSLLRRGARLVCDLVTCVVTSSSVMRVALRDLGVRARIEVIPNGVDNERFRPLDSQIEGIEIRRRLGVPGEAPVLLFVGPVAPRKRVDLLLEAWREIAAAHPDAYLVIAGPRLDATRPHWADYHRRIEALAGDSGARGRLRFLGLIEDVEAAMRAADIFVFTSSREGMPNVIPEAMASGVPVVTTPFIGLPAEFGEPGRHFVLTEFDAHRIAQDVSHLLATSRARRRFAAEGLAWVEGHLGIQRSLDSYADLYRELSAGRP